MYSIVVLLAIMGGRAFGLSCVCVFVCLCVCVCVCVCVCSALERESVCV